MSERTQIEMDGFTYEVINNWNVQHGHRVLIEGHRIKILKPIHQLGIVKTKSKPHTTSSD